MDRLGPSVHSLIGMLQRFLVTAQLLACVFAVPAGCFTPSDVDQARMDTGTESSGGSSGGTECAVGSVACSCYGNVTCDAGLVCDPTLRLCVAEGCHAGTLDCSCVDGVCLVGLVCSEGRCGPPEASSTSEGDGTTDASSSGDSSGSIGTESSSGEPAVDVCAAEPDDDSCDECTKTSCCDQLSICDEDPDCRCVLECLDTYANPSLPEAQTCAGECGVDFLVVGSMLMELEACRQLSCSDACA